MSDITTAVFQQFIAEVRKHRETTDKELDLVADLIQAFGKRLVILELEMDAIQKRDKEMNAGEE